MTPLTLPRGRRARAQERGAVLLTVIVITVVLTLVAAAAIAASSSELGAVRNRSAGDRLLACAEAGRAHLLSMFRTVGEAPRSLSARLDDATANATSSLTTCPDGAPPAAGVCARTGHIGQNGTTVVGVRALPAGYGAQRRGARDLSNVVASPNALGDGTPYQVVVHCQDELGRESEVEFVMRFGI